MKVQKTVKLSVWITVEVDEDLIGTDGVDDPFQVEENVSYAIQYMEDAKELFRGADVKEYSVALETVEDTNYQYL